MGAGRRPAAARRRRGRDEGLCGGRGRVPLDSRASARQSRPQLGHGREGRPFGGCASGEGFAVGRATSRPYGRPPTSAGEWRWQSRPHCVDRSHPGPRGETWVAAVDTTSDRRPVGRPAHDGAEHTTGVLVSLDRDEARLTDLGGARQSHRSGCPTPRGCGAGGPQHRGGPPARRRATLTTRNTLLERPHNADDRAPSGAAIEYLLPIRARVAHGGTPVPCSRVRTHTTRCRGCRTRRNC